MSFDGIYRGIVVNNVDPMGMNRLKLTCPWVFGNNTTQTGWALPCLTPGAGFEIPPVGSGVVMFFEGGDVDYPNWMGVWQPSLTPTPTAQVESVFTAEGQLIAGTGPGKGELLSPGTSGAVLTIGGSDPSGLQWDIPTPSVITSGFINGYGGSTAPSGWLMCDGTSYSTTGVTAALFAAIGYTNGGSGANFNVPDLRGRVPVGVGALGTNGQPTVTLGGTTGNGVGGEAAHTLSEGELAAHSHGGATGTESAFHQHQPIPGFQVAVETSSTEGLASPGLSNAAFTANASGNQNALHIHGVASDGSNTPHNNLQPLLGINYIIKL